LFILFAPSKTFSEQVHVMGKGEVSGMILVVCAKYWEGGRRENGLSLFRKM